MSVIEKLYKKLETNLMNAKIERVRYQKDWDDIENDPEDMRNESEIETLDRILNWEEFNEVR